MKRRAKAGLWIALALVLTGAAKPPEKQSEKAVAKSTAEQIADLQRRVEELESQQSEVLGESGEHRGQVSSFLGKPIAIGGFFEPGFTAITGPDTPGQISNSSNLLGINLGAELSRDVRLVFQTLTALQLNLQNPHNDPRGTAAGVGSRRGLDQLFFGSLIAHGYFEYSLSENVRLQGGLGYVPFGTSFQFREPVLFLRRGGPLMLRTTDVVDPLWSGLHLLGQFATEKDRWGYDLYTLGLDFNIHAPGAGARVWRSFSRERITLGLSSQVGKRSDDTFNTWGADARIKFGRFRVTSELAYQFARGDNPWSAYLEPAVDVYREIVLVYVNADFTSSPYNLTGAGATALSDPYRKLEYGAGVNWLPMSFTRFRLGFTVHDYVGDTAVVSGQNRDYTSIDLSAGVAF